LCGDLHLVAVVHAGEGGPGGGFGGLGCHKKGQRYCEQGGRTHVMQTGPGWGGVHAVPLSVRRLAYAGVKFGSIRYR
jgi:hypothetical protein